MEFNKHIAALRSTTELEVLSPTTTSYDKDESLEFLGSKFSLRALLYLTEWEHHLLKHKQQLLEHSRIWGEHSESTQQYKRLIVTSMASSAKDHIGMESQDLSCYHPPPAEAFIHGRWAEEHGPSTRKEDTEEDYSWNKQ